MARSSVELVYLDPQDLCEDTGKIQDSQEQKEYNQSLVYHQENYNSITTINSTQMHMMKADLNLKSIYG